MDQPISSPVGNNFAILASAGTGKTYQLSVRIARLLMLEKVKPNEIIALTFTRAAAAEFYLRTLERLRDAAESDGKYAAAVTAEMARGKVSGFYVERVEVNDVTDKAAQMRQKREERLAGRSAG